MANQITFTPLATTATPSPSPVTYTPTTTGEFLVQQGTHARRIENVAIDRTELTYVRDRGRAAKPVTAIGLDTFSDLATANTQLAKLEQMPGAECEIQSTVWGTISSAKCVRTNAPIVERNAHPGYHIRYRLEFLVNSE